MSSTYALNSSGQTARRSGDGADVPWDTAAGQPVDIDGQAGSIWRADGSPAPSAALVVPVTPSVTGRQMNGQARAAGITGALNTVLTSTTSTAKPDDIRYVNSVGLDTRMPVDNPKAARVLALAGVQDVPGFMAAALLLPA